MIVLGVCLGLWCTVLEIGQLVLINQPEQSITPEQTYTLDQHGTGGCADVVQ